MTSPPAQLCLDALTRLGRSLPALGTTDEAAAEVTATLSTLGVVVGVAAVQSDVAEVVAVHVPDRAHTRLSSALAARVSGMRIPIGTVDFLRNAVHLRQPYAGIAGAGEPLRRFADDAALATALPTAADALGEVSVPIVVRDRVAGVLWAWGPDGCAQLAPALEAAAAMLASCWGDGGDSSARFAPAGSAQGHPARRRSIESLVRHGEIQAGVQPIVRMFDSSVIAYEALARFTPRDPVLTPDHLFSAAASLNMQAAVDLACLRGALREAHKFCGADLFANVLIGTLLDRSGMAALDDAVRDAGVDPAGVVLEFSEREPVPDLARLQAIAAELRARGFRIAVDDAGSGHASMRLIAELRPEFIKVDRSLISAVDTDNARRALVVALLSFSGHIGARLVAEGIETEAEKETLLRLGVMFGQGYLLGRPVLTSPLEGHPRASVVDDAWFGRQRVAPTRAAMAPSQAAPGNATTAADFETPRPRSRRGLARALSDAAHALQNEHDPMRIVDVIAEMMRRVVPVSEMTILAADYEAHRFVPMIATGPDREQLLATSYGMDAGVTGWAFARGRPEYLPDTGKHPAARQVPGTAVVQQSVLLIPLIAGEHKLGMITCWRLGFDKFSPGDLEAASLFAHVAAAAWRNAQLYAELVEAAMTDPLTRLYNSRWLREQGESELVAAAQGNHRVSLLLIDLDRFKSVNDDAGHATGDLVLQRVAARLRATVRSADSVVRFGGEEFVVLLPDCDVVAARSVAEALRAAVRDVTLPDACATRDLTTSIGVATFPHHGNDLDSLLAAADRAMYAAKSEGRDRVAEAAARFGSASIVPLAPRRRRQRRPDPRIASAG